MKTILFQGDSITDVLRPRESEVYKGCGYVTMVSGKLGLDYPNEYDFINRGISGNRIVDIYARMKIDIINLKPDYMSILVGVNDVLHESIGNGVSAEKFEKIYSMLLEELLEELPDLKIMILEPFVLKCTGTEQNWDYTYGEVLKRSAAAKRIAESFGVPFVTLLEKFMELTKSAPPSYWCSDGIHPSAAGHEMIAREWVKAFMQIK